MDDVWASPENVPGRGTIAAFMPAETKAVDFCTLTAESDKFREFSPF